MLEIKIFSFYLAPRTLYLNLSNKLDVEIYRNIDC